MKVSQTASRTSTDTYSVGIANEPEYREIAKLVDDAAPGAISNWDERLRNLKAIRINPVNRCELLVAQDDVTKTIIGALVIGFGFNDGNNAWGDHAWMRLEAIAVRNQAQPGEVGRKLLQHLGDNASRRGYVGIYARPQNAPESVINFYASCGFEIIPQELAFDPLEPNGTHCPKPMTALPGEHIVAAITAHGRSHGRDWYRTR